ncbi:hypothetical protein [Paenibacillus naphthalenovorans]|uniref:hypothetical protein n=1 Tax=Paenibacillus naphthalenovorans TaxID=162209 RepID=UPI003D28BAA7
MANNDNGNNNGKRQGKMPSRYVNGEKQYWSEERQSWGVFRPYFKHPKTGELVWARMTGHRSFFIPVG